MLAIVFSALLVQVHLLLCILLPGLAIRLFWRGAEPDVCKTGTHVLEALALGSLWATLQFLVLYCTGLVMLTGVPGLLGAKYATDLAVVLFFILRSASGFPGLLKMSGHIVRTLLKPANLVGLLVASLYGLYAAIQHPYAADNAALYWLAAAVADFSTTFVFAQGSPAYIAWLYWPSLCAWPEVAPGTIAAAAKIALNVAAFFTLKRLCFLWPPTSKGWVALLAYLLVLVTFLGLYGLLETGKETVFGILFLFCAMTQLVRKEKVEEAGSSAFTSGCLLSLAFGFGAISIPYAAVFLVLCLIVNSEGRDVPALLIKIGVLVGIPLVFSLATMLHRPMWVSTVVVVVVLLLIHMGRPAIQRIITALSLFVRPRRRLVETLMLALPVLGVFCLLPVEYVKRNLSPLDGLTSFADIFMASNGLLPSGVSVLAFLGFVLVLCRPSPEQNMPGIVALASFPFVVLLPPLMFAHLPDLPIPFHPQHLWDLTKDIPNWCWGILACFFFLVVLSSGIDFLAGVLTKLSSRLAKARRTVFAGIFLGLTFAGGCWFLRTKEMVWYFGSIKAAYLSTNGGHVDLTLALFINGVLRELTESADRDASRSLWPVVLDKSAHLSKDHAGLQLQACGVTPRFEDLDILGAGGSMSKSSHGFIIADRTVTEEWQQKNRSLTLTELTRASENQSLFRFQRKTGGMGAFIAAKLAPFPFPTPSLAGNIYSPPRVFFADLASTTIREKQGDQYLWGKQSGTVFASLPMFRRNNRSLHIRVKFFAGPDSTLTVTSPALSSPIVLSPETKSMSMELKVDYARLAEPINDAAWIPLHFSYEGALRHHDKLGYLNAYYIDKFSIFGVTHID